ncbi:MAG: LysR family transcriptional regulator [Eubacterium sp.]|jgi:DNA-binding transcriptional LysR family regulator
MTLQQMHYALTIAECGSMNKAAEKLFLSQPALTNTMRSLEEEIGINIFLRSKRGVTPTSEGEEFLAYVRQLYQQYELLKERYSPDAEFKRKFGVSAQHYTFAVRAFVDTVRKFDTLEFEYAMRETRTREVIQDVAQMRSEIGILYMSAYNEKIIEKMLHEKDLEFHELVQARAYVYLCEKHPLAKCREVTMDQLKDFPCLSFEQDVQSSVYLAEEILSENEYPRTIQVNDRATMLNLMDSLNGYTLCSGVIFDDLNGDGCLAVPFREDAEDSSGLMRIGYVVKRNSIRSEMGEYYLESCRRCLQLIRK